MPLQVSYKKQFVLGILLLIVILVVIEGIVNVWWNVGLANCAFENDEFLTNVDKETKRQLCIENYALQFFDTRAMPSTGFIHINSEGFRGPEFSILKPENTYRIFIVGGSTVFGSGAFDNQTSAAYLQGRFADGGLGFVEVINAGIGSAVSKTETKLIKGNLLKYDPDLFIVYDGWNDMKNKKLNDGAEILWKERWAEICDLGKNYDFETIITLQPFLGSGNKILTKIESQNYIEYNIPQYFEKYQLYAEQLAELNEHCEKVADLRGAFDLVPEPIHFDKAHVVALGNKIIADQFYELSLPLVLQKIDEPISSDKSKVSSTKGLLDDKLDSEDSNSLLEKSYGTVETLISLYKTPRAFLYILTNFYNQPVGQTIFLDPSQETRSVTTYNMTFKAPDQFYTSVNVDSMPRYKELKVGVEVTISGKLLAVDKEKTPIPGREVHLVEGMGPRKYLTSGITNDDGQFNLTWVPENYEGFVGLMHVEFSGDDQFAFRDSIPYLATFEDDENSHEVKKSKSETMN